MADAGCRGLRGEDGDCGCVDALVRANRAIGVHVAAELCRVFFRGSYETELWKVMAERGIPICVRCGYSLAGAVERRCPECGAVADSVRE